MFETQDKWETHLRPAFLKNLEISGKVLKSLSFSGNKIDLILLIAYFMLVSYRKIIGFESEKFVQKSGKINWQQLSVKIWDSLGN